MFSAQMVLALLAGTKTQTRRVLKHRHDWHVDEVPNRNGVYRPWPVFEGYVYAQPDPVEVACPFGVPGDKLWVKEGIRRNLLGGKSQGTVAHYIADGSPAPVDSWGWKNSALPGMFMPRGVSRIMLEVLEVRLERLNSISAADATAEGIYVPEVDYSVTDDPRTLDFERERYAISQYRSVWEAINGPGSWDTNPFVWRILFRRIR